MEHTLKRHLNLKTRNHATIVHVHLAYEKIKTELKNLVSILDMDLLKEEDKIASDLEKQVLAYEKKASVEMSSKIMVS